MPRRLNTTAASGAVLACLALAAGAGPAGAAQTFGADLSSQGAGNGCTVACSMHTAVRSDGSNETGAPSTGILTQVRFKYRGDGGSGRFTVLQLETPATNNWRSIGPDLPFSVSATATDKIFAFNVRRPISAGQRLGLSASNTLAGSDVSLQPTDRYEASGSPRVLLFASGEHQADTVKTYSPAPSGSTEQFELLVNGTVEPDADGDGFGDDSQDGCKGTRGPQGGCQAPVANTGGAVTQQPVAPSNLFAFGSFRGSILVLNLPGPGRVVVGDASVTSPTASARRRRRAGLIKRKRVTVSKAGVLKVRLKLSKAGKTRLRRRGKVRVRVRANYTPTGGSTRSKTKKLTFKRRR